MGVPVITLAGQTHVSRVGVSLLSAVGLPELITASAAAYQQTAIALASDLERLQQLRATLRDRLQTSPLMDAALITQSIETAYRTMWQSWCENQQSFLANQLQAAAQLLHRGELERAKSQYQNILYQHPNQAYANFCLGYIYQQQKSITNAISYYQAAVESNPNYLEALNNLGNLHWKEGDLSEAIQCYQKTIELQPEVASGYYNLGLIHTDQEQFEEALAAYQKAIELGDNQADIHCKMSLVYLQQDKVLEAYQNYQKALQHQPDYAVAHFGLGFLHSKQAQISDAIAAYQRAISLTPDYAAAHNNLGNAFRSQGKLSEAIAAYRRALQLQPDYVAAHTNLLFTLNCSDAYEPTAVYQEHRQWAAHHTASLTRTFQFYENDRKEDRRLRIGYVSGDLRSHSVAYFLEPLLAAHDHRHFEIVCYANNQEVDATTQRLQQLADDWKNIATLGNGQIATLIRQDAIDILVDLSGHTNGNRLLVFARKPAPLQVSYIGYPNTTGLDTIDYRFTDAWADPEGQTEALHTEELVRLPHGFLCYQPVLECPAVGPLPSIETGYITFGSFNDLSKVSPRIIAQWSAILAAVPRARLMIKAKSLIDKGTRDVIHSLFQQHGMPEDRVELQGQTASQTEHLALYNQVDIALDTFPYNGTTTTCEALWMGVPVITLAGPTHVSRVGDSLLSRVGLPEFVTESVEAYQQTAIALATNRDRLQTYRASLRHRLQTSPLMNADLMTRSVEAAYRRVWQSWCSQADATVERHLQAGYSFFGQGDFEQASQQYQAALHKDPEHAYANFCLGCVYQNQSNFTGAIAAYQKAVQSQPDYVEALSNLGNVYKEKGYLDKAIQSLQTAIGLQPNHPDSYVNLGSVLRLQGKFSAAIAAYQKALQLNPNIAEAQNNLGNALKEQGKFSEAIAAYRQALQLNPNYGVAHSNLVFALNYSTDYDPQAIYREHQYWATSQVKVSPQTQPSHKCDRTPNRRLRIGYVSADFKAHSVAYFLEPLLAAHDHRNFEIICYSNSQKVDETTRRLQQLVDGWQTIVTMNDEAAADLIRQDAIDILVDLSGHTKGNRLLVFAQKPAPLQVTYLGYPNTTGLDTIDYRLTDTWADPEGSAPLHTEQLVCLPHGFLCYQPWPESPAVSPSPAPTNQYITFGSCNNLAKVSPQVVTEWSAILSAVPGSKLIMKAKSLGDTGTQDYLYNLFQQQGIARDRIELLARIPSQAEHLALYNQVDIALDTFPYNGTTTTCEALWMGVPVITLAGQTHASRVGVSLLSGVGLPNLITTSVNDYRQRAIALASNLDQLQQLRRTMRDRMKQSPLTNATLITHSIEAAYRTMWQSWCDCPADSMNTIDAKQNKLQPQSANRETQHPDIKTQPASTKNIPFSDMSTNQQELSTKPRKLHIGGKVKAPDWEVLNAVPAAYVDHVGNANDLSQFENDTFTDIYASHLVEHLDYRDELVNTLKEWHRVLVPGGKVYISVPDMDVLAKLFIAKEKLNFSERFMVMRMMFGGHVDQYDYHAVGLNQEFLAMYLNQAGYINIRRVDRFGLFNDTSNYVFKDVLISLNLIAEKPKKAAPATQKTMTVNELLKLANELGAQGQTQKAADYYQQILAVDPNSFAATVNLGNMLKTQGNYSAALEYYRKALTIIPDNPAVENNIGGILKDQGLISEAVNCFYKASTDPNFRMARSNLLLTLNYSSDHEPSAMYEEHRVWANLCAAPLAEKIRPFDNDPNPERRLRIGYVSGDFHTHSVAYFFEPLLAATNRDSFEVICYANNARIDAVTQRLQHLASNWRDIRPLQDEQVADQIRQDKIDILVDLSGHTSGSRLLVFAYKPAPVQVTYIGYPNTTGLDTMDYRLTDAWADPEGQTEAWHTEQLVRLPHGFLCYQPPSDGPEVGPLPASTAGHITLGSFNTLAKVSPQLIGYWSAMLTAVPKARIIIKAAPLADTGIQDSVKRSFEQNGVTSDRVELLGRIPSRADHLSLYNRIDIALDPFPYNGTTTTCEALWMGVPVVTWAGQIHTSRVGVSLLSSVGLEDLITESPEAYVQKAIALASDQEQLQQLRETMRDQMRQAPLTNAKLITQSLENAYRDMWRQWCNTRD